MKIGLMSFAHGHANGYANAIKNLPDAEIISIYDDNVKRGQEAAERYNTTFYEDQEAFLSQEMDAVIICSENSRHKEMVVNAAKAKKHILCEKPIATNLKDAQEMIDVCKENQVILQVAYPVRFSTPIAQLKKMIDDGEFGEIVAFRTTNRGRNPGGWFIDKELSGGGAVLDHTVHMVDIMRWYLNEEITEVEANVDTYFNDIDIDDAGILTLEFANGVIASHDASWSRYDEYPIWGDVTIEVIGTKQTVKVNALKEHLRVFGTGSRSYRHVAFGNNMDAGLVRDFVDCVKEKREPSVTGYDGLKSLEVALAAYEASDSGKKVKL